ncbi:hypothetical protein T11_12445 [Trichinella zimbabwensis]|uniref:Uncharacterized protein n=1 Tax=Trichinella zimbabwensis TaxID=268475 RepID=A0A0V1HGZ9_9BILA|nr:hypothetical protein T11_12445 [Trichinella zimbabwensis]
MAKISTFNNSLLFKPANCYPFLTLFRSILYSQFRFYCEVIHCDKSLDFHRITQLVLIVKNQHVSILSICASSLQEVEKLFVSNDYENLLCNYFYKDQVKLIWHRLI